MTTSIKLGPFPQGGRALQDLLYFVRGEPVICHDRGFLGTVGGFIINSDGRFRHLYPLPYYAEDFFIHGGGSVYRFNGDDVTRQLARLRGQIACCWEQARGLKGNSGKSAVRLSERLVRLFEQARRTASFLPDIEGPHQGKGPKYKKPLSYTQLYGPRSKIHTDPFLQGAARAFRPFNAEVTRQALTAKLFTNTNEKLVTILDRIKNPVLVMERMVHLLRRSSSIPFMFGVALLYGIAWPKLGELVV